MTWKSIAGIALLLIAQIAFAQTTANLTGTVTSDATPLPGVTVTITSPNLQGTRTAITDANGNYNFAALPPGEYTVKFEMEGMQAVTRTTRVSLAETARADAALAVSKLTESLTVTAAATPVVETTEIQTNLPQSLVEKLPTNRTLVTTVDLAPNTTQNGPNNATTISGAPSYENTFYVDGSVINEVLRGQPNNLFIEDALQETTVQTGAISAEFGRFTGGVVTAISKSGGNEFSGSLRDSIANPRWTAQTPLGEPRPDSKLFNVYEGTLGGRIVRDRLWFFAAGRYRNRDLQQSLFRQPQATYINADDERRYEAKLTAQITPKHSLIGSYVDVRDSQTNNCAGNCYELSTLDTPRKLPNSFATLNYNGMLSNNALVEASFARQTLKFEGGGGVPTGDLATSSVIVTSEGNLAGYPLFCGVCAPPEQRNNQNAKVMGNYFWAPKGLGTHNLTGGVEQFSDMLKSDNHQSASDFEIFTLREPQILANGTVAPVIPNFGAFVVWWPILEHTRGNRFTTDSAFLNDKWDLNNRFSFNIGVRYDHDNGENSAHAKVASDSLISPRLGVIYDAFGNGRLRFNASYSVYTSKIANGDVGDATSAAGAPSILYWIYGGPSISGVSSTDAMRQVFDWFNGVGGTSNTDFLAGGGTAGISTIIPHDLRSPSVGEYTFGVGGNITSNAFLRADYQYRKFRNFYTTVTNSSTGQVLDPLIGIPVDLSYLVNSNDLRRTYQAIVLQGGWHATHRLNVGGNYTFSKLRGNIVEETAGAGPVPSSGPQQYPEFQGFPQNNPVGYLAGDERNKLRAWVTYDLPFVHFGTLTVGALQRYDSGTPYSLIGSIDPVQSADCPQCVDPSQYNYLNPPQTVNYYFSGRGQFRYDNIASTDLSLDYFVPISSAQLFVEAQTLNVFDRHGRVAFNTDVNVLQAFNPFTETPVEGVNWEKGPDFGKAQNPTSLFTQGDYQLPRTFRVSIGARF
ncbi:MAG TPA: TonB-dependent receptor [Thermoanaerobaculia bacterium]|nr:TonB-dependent receptor [Thermoanaerobaculia bacterium]